MYQRFNDSGPFSALLKEKVDRHEHCRMDGEDKFPSLFSYSHVRTPCVTFKCGHHASRSGAMDIHILSCSGVRGPLASRVLAPNAAP